MNMIPARTTIAIHLLVVIAGILVGFQQVVMIPGVPDHGR